MTTDLADFDQPLGKLFPPVSVADYERYRLSDAQIAHYNQHGFVSGIQVLDEQQCDQLCDELVRLADPSSPGNDLFYEFHTNESSTPETILFHALGAWRIAPGMHDLLWHPAITVPASQLLEGGVRFWHDQLFCKPAHHGGVVAWHQDYSYWTRTIPMSHLTCWVGLDRATRDNGCMQYIPGSHQWSLLPITGLAGQMDAIREVLTAEQARTFEKPVAVELARGACTFHHPLLIHGSAENRTDGPRRAAVVNMFRDGVISDQDDSPLGGVPPIPRGQKMQGKFFPLLYDPKHWVRKCELLG